MFFKALLNCIRRFYLNKYVTNFYSQNQVDGMFFKFKCIERWLQRKLVNAMTSSFFGTLPYGRLYSINSKYSPPFLREQLSSLTHWCQAGPCDLLWPMRRGWKWPEVLVSGTVKIPPVLHPASLFPGLLRQAMSEMWGRAGPTCRECVVRSREQYRNPLLLQATQSVGCILPWPHSASAGWCTCVQGCALFKGPKPYFKRVL